jgi:NADP-dependent aldehyde dehydrogenase
LFKTDFQTFQSTEQLKEEMFGPASVVIEGSSKDDLLQAAREMDGHLTATVHGTEEDLAAYRELLEILEQKVGRVLINGFPTGVEVSHAMVHGGPFPATTDAHSTSVGTTAIYRFTRPVCYQDYPQALLPAELKDENPLNIMRLENGEFKR